MSALKELIALGNEVGLSGAPLVEFVREEQAKEREDRQRKRDEAKQEEERRQQELHLQREEDQLIFQRDMEREKITLQRELEKEREERAIEEHRRKVELLTLQEKLSSKPEGTNVAPSARGPKLTPFDEDKDNIHSYLQRFERYAITQNWEKSVHWASNLSVLLKGRALDVFSRLPRDQSLDYDVLKSALLKRFEMTEDGFRKRFRSGRPETGETFSQFAVRLESYFVRWLELGNTGNDFDSLKDLMVRDQFLQAYGSELTLFLKERTPSSIMEMSKLADQYADARANPNNLVRPKHNSSKGASHGTGKSDQKDTAKLASSNSSKDTIRQCYVCKGTDHLANRCPKRSSKNRVMSVTEESSHIESKVGSNQCDTREENHCWKAEEKSTNERSSFQDVIDMNVSCNLPMPAPCKMPVVEGLVGSQRVSVLRDTGCTGVVLKRSLVTLDQMTGESRLCTLADGSSLQVPTAKVVVDTPYFVGPVVAWCMESPVYDLILGNIEGALAPGEPNPYWKQKKEKIAAVETRAQKRLQEKPYRALKVPNALNMDSLMICRLAL